jgi:hypothetical protein
LEERERLLEEGERQSPWEQRQEDSMNEFFNPLQGNNFQEPFFYNELPNPLQNNNFQEPLYGFEEQRQQQLYQSWSQLSYGQLEQIEEEYYPYYPMDEFGYSDPPSSNNSRRDHTQ